MLLISALWLAVVHAMASLAIPAGARGPVDGQWRLAGIAATRGASPVGLARPQRAERRLWGLFLGDEQFRPSAPQRLRAADRSSDRSVSPLRSPPGVVAVASAGLPLSPASLMPPARHQLSHAAASRGGHLPYYPTAPPLQG